MVQCEPTWLDAKSIGDSCSWCSVNPPGQTLNLCHKSEFTKAGELGKTSLSPPRGALLLLRGLKKVYLRGGGVAKLEMGIS